MSDAVGLFPFSKYEDSLNTNLVASARKEMESETYSQQQDKNPVFFFLAFNHESIKK